MSAAETSPVESRELPCKVVACCTDAAEVTLLPCWKAAMAD